MTSKERLITALRRGTPDRVPVTLYEFSHLGDNRPTQEPGYAALLELQRRLGDTFVFVHVGLGDLGDPNSVTEGSADLDQPQSRTVTLRTPQGDLTAIHRRDPGTITWWQVKPFVRTAEDCRKWLSLKPAAVEPDVSRVLRLQRELGEDGLVVLGAGTALCQVVSLFHYDDFALLLLEDEGLIRAMLDVSADALNAGVRKTAAQVREVCFRFYGPEYAGAPLLNPHRYFDPLATAYDRVPIALVNESGNFSLVHCHGRLDAILEKIAAIRPTALEPLEVLPAATADVTMAQVKARVGGSLCLMGGIQAHEMERLTPPEIERRVKEILEAAAPGGGFILLPTSTPIDYPLRPAIVDNYRAYFEAARKYGKYPIAG